MSKKIKKSIKEYNDNSNLKNPDKELEIKIKGLRNIFNSTYIPQNYNYNYHAYAISNRLRNKNKFLSV